MIGRSSSDTRNGCGVMITMVLFCSLSAGFSANAEEISLSSLLGYSINAEWIANSKHTWVETSGQKRLAGGPVRFVDKLYISNNGRIFHRRQLYYLDRTKPIFSYDNIRSGRGETFRLDANSTFVHTSIPSDDKERTNYTRIVKIALSQSDGSYSCSVKASLALQKGEKQYLNYEPSGRYRIIHSFKSRQKSCRVFKGNVFKGEVGP